MYSYYVFWSTRRILLLSCYSVRHWGRIEGFANGAFHPRHAAAQPLIHLLRNTSYRSSGGIISHIVPFLSTWFHNLSEPLSSAKSAGNGASCSEKAHYSVGLRKIRFFKRATNISTVPHSSCCLGKTKTTYSNNVIGLVSLKQHE